MLKGFKKLVSLALVLVVSMVVSVPAFAEGNDTSFKKNSGNGSIIIIENDQDLKEMQEQDEEEYKSKLSAIDISLQNDFKQFYTYYQKMYPNSNELTSEAGNKEESFLNAFLERYPQYKIVDRALLKKEVETLGFNIVVEAVRAFFNVNGYQLSLTLFNHSLSDNPASVIMNLTGSSTGLYGYVKKLLKNDVFFITMDLFSKQGKTPSYVSDSSSFDDGDLYWAIHSFQWERERTQYNKATFKISDEYDFKKWQDIPGIVAGLANTHDYHIEISGLVQNGKIM